MTEKINYNGKEYPVKVGYYALKHTAREIKETQGRDIGIMDVLSDDITVLEPLLFHSMVMGARLENQVFQIERIEAEFILDECLPEFMRLIPKFFKANFGNEEETKKEEANPKATTEEKK